MGTDLSAFTMFLAFKGSTRGRCCGRPGRFQNGSTTSRRVGCHGSCDMAVSCHVCRGGNLYRGDCCAGFGCRPVSPGCPSGSLRTRLSVYPVYMPAPEGDVLHDSSYMPLPAYLVRGTRGIPCMQGASHGRCGRLCSSADCGTRDLLPVDSPVLHGM